MTTTALLPLPVDSEATRQFTLWALAAARFQVEPQGNRAYVLRIPEDRPDLFNGASSVRFCFGEEHGPSATEQVSPDSRMFQWVLRQLQQCGHATHSQPRDYPQSIHEITPKLFAAYQIDGGSVHLGGCTLEERPLLRLTYRDSANGSTAARLKSRYFAPDGAAVPDDLALTLGLDDLVPAPQLAWRLEESDLVNWLVLARDAIAQTKAGGLAPEETVPEATTEYLAATVIWLKYARGKLVFVFGESTAELAFEAWSRLFALGRQIPPLVCPYSGQRSYHLAATDDGQIAAADAIGTCEISGRRVLKSELKQCEATGRWVSRKFLKTCPVSERRMIDEALVRCGMCCQTVSVAVVKQDRCLACRSLGAVRKEQPRLARVLGEYPRLDGWRRWKMSETATAYVLEAESFWRRLLLVLDKESLGLLHIASASRWSNQWVEVPEPQRREWLGG